ncbi:MAG: hypothetical protein CFK49_00435 [Armatimonadetes bacterium JP3_11]|jgi:uncharacterized protein (DUF58 family)|nr:MAG: hypothetical protein CFK48_01920 [Armatimonadetes bacterium CP1_7O]OYT75991.1 MAG: hypothetical protein CFK49_00435 [Armatimonadetes bacterium JP3_11]RMH08507.1 MAG: DUF58 domain-containing protein [Armatimonadota bacterium]
MREYKLTALMAATSFLLCSGLMTNNRQMYWMASVLGALMLGTYLIVKRGAQRLSVARRCPTEMVEGETVEAQLAVVAPSRNGLLWIKAEETVSSGLMLEPIETESSTPHSSVVSYRLTALRRGEQQLGPVKLTLSDPFGLFFHSQQIDDITSILVLPRPVQLPNWRWEGGGHGRFAASALRGRRGEGSDWHGVRPYTPGDPLRRIHWRATARHGQWHVKEFETSQLAPTVIALEQAPTWRAEGDVYPDFDQVIRHIAWIALEAPRQGVSLILVGSNLPELRLTPENYADPRVLLRQLARIQPNANHSILDDLPRLIQQYGEQYRIALFVPPQNYAPCHARVQPYLAQGYSVEVYA